MKVYKHESDGVNAGQSRHTISGLADRPLLDGYSVRECIEIDGDGLSTDASTGAIYYRDFEARLEDSGSAIIVYDRMSRQQVAACKILSRTAGPFCDTPAPSRADLSPVTER